MTPWEWVRAIAILGPILCLIALGLFVTARSGVAHLATAGGSRQLVQNLSQTLVLLGGCLIGLALIHQLVGQQLPRMW